MDLYEESSFENPPRGLGLHPYRPFLISVKQRLRSRVRSFRYRVWGSTLNILYIGFRVRFRV